MMSIPGTIIVALGLVLLIVSLFADPIGLGNDPGFGNDQVMGTAAAVVIIVLGSLLIFRKRKRDSD